MSALGGAGGGGRGSLPPKLYFRIGEVAGLVGVEPHVLRYWEREFRSIRPTKSAKGQRVYSRRDVENLLRVRDLLYSEGFTIAGAKKRLLRSGVETSAQGVTAATSAPTSAPTSTPTSTSTSTSTPTSTPTSTSTSTSTSSSTQALTAGAPGARANLTAKVGFAPASGPVATAAAPARVREKLTALRVEVEAFLKELGG